MTCSLPTGSVSMRDSDLRNRGMRLVMARIALRIGLASGDSLCENRCDRDQSSRKQGICVAHYLPSRCVLCACPPACTWRESDIGRRGRERGKGARGRVRGSGHRETVYGD